MAKTSIIQQGDGTYVADATPDDYQSIFRSAIEAINENQKLLDQISSRKKPKNPKAHANAIQELSRQLRHSGLLAEVVGRAYSRSVLETLIDPKRVEDDKYIEISRRPKVNRLKGGKRNKRDRRLDLPDKFWRWAHRNKKKEMSRKTGEQIPIETIDDWYEEWMNLPDEKQDAYEILKPFAKP
jgi:hypothetical protein